MIHKVHRILNRRKTLFQHFLPFSSNDVCYAEEPGNYLSSRQGEGRGRERKKAMKHSKIETLIKVFCLIPAHNDLRAYDLANETFGSGIHLFSFFFCVWRKWRASWQRRKLFQFFSRFSILHEISFISLYD